MLRERRWDIAFDRVRGRRELVSTIATPLRTPAGEITIADVIRAIDGPLATVRDTPFKDLVYEGPAEGMLEIWMAVRASLRSVLEHVTLADTFTRVTDQPV